MVTAVRTEVSDALGSISVNRPVGGGRSVASAVEGPIPAASGVGEVVAQIPPVSAAGNSQPDKQQPEKQEASPSFAGRFQNLGGSFAAAYDVRLVAEVADDPRLISIPEPQSFSGLVVRAVNLYESTGLVVTGTPPRGTALNASS